MVSRTHKLAIAAMALLDLFLSVTFAALAGLTHYGGWYNLADCDPIDYATCGIDMIIMCALRLGAVLAIVLWLALCLGDNATGFVLGRSSGGRSSSASSSKKPTTSSNEERQPLIGGDDKARPSASAPSLNTTDVAATRASATAASGTVVAIPPPPTSIEVPWPEAREGAARRAREAVRIRIASTLFFTVFTLTNVLTSLKGLEYDFHISPWHELALGFAIGVASVQLRLVVGVLRSRHDDEVDAHILQLHSHPLRFRSELSFCICDVCRLRIKTREAFSCEMCDFDACAECMKAAFIRGAAGAVPGGGSVGPARVGPGGGGVTPPAAVSTVAKPSGGAPSGGGPAQRPTAFAGGSANTTTTSLGRYEAIQISNFEYVRRILKLASSYMHLVILSLVLILAIQGSRLASPNYQGKIIDEITRSDFNGFIMNLKFFAGIRVAQLVLGSLSSLMRTIVARLLTNSARRELFKALIHQDIEFFDMSTTGALTSRMTNDVNAMLAPATDLLYSMLSNLALLIGGMVMCLVKSWRLALLTITVVGPIIVVTEVYSIFSRRINRRIRDSLANANSAATEAFTNIRTVRALSTESLEKDKFETSMLEALSRSVVDAMANAGTYFVTGMLDFGMVTLTLGFGGDMVLRGRNGLTIGDLVAFQMYASMMNTAYQGLNNMVNEMTKATGAAERVYGLLELKPSIRFDEGERPADFEGAVEFRAIKFRYPTRPGNVVLNGAQLTCPARKVTAIVGSSGGGKSTLISLLLRLYDPEGGQILVDGRDTRTLDIEWLHRHIAVVMQETQLFATSILANIMYGAPPGTTREDVEAAAKKANAHDFIMTFEDGYNTQVGERGVRLSGGQKQRISIARAFLRKPKLLLLDEATSALDAQSEAQVQRALDALLEDLTGDGSQCTVIVVAHRLSTIVGAFQIAVMDKGVVAEIGTHAVLSADEKSVYRRVVMPAMSGAASTTPAAPTASAST